MASNEIRFTRLLAGALPPAVTIHPKVSTRLDTGFIFHSDVPGSYCYVPEDCVEIDALGRVTVDEIAYFNSGWCVRNRRWADSEEGGTYLFPDPARIVDDFSAPDIQVFLHRLSQHHPPPVPDDHGGAVSA